jgi:hypothetical protein
MDKVKKASLVRGEDRKENIKKCLTLIREDLEPIRNAKNILIKPNLVALKPDFANTSVEAIEAVIEFVRDIVPNTPITVGESSATAFYRGLPTTTVFESYDYYRLEKKYTNVSLTDFDSDTEVIDSPIHSVIGDTHLRITKRVNEFDYKISLSIPKTHNFAIATFGIKNMAGLVLRQDMAMIHGMKGGIEVDAPKTLLDKLPAGTVSRIASADPVKADGIGARLIGFEPEEIGYLYYLKEEEHMGEYSLDNLAGNDLMTIRRTFKRHGTYDIQSQWHEEEKLKIKM